MFQSAAVPTRARGGSGHLGAADPTPTTQTTAFFGFRAVYPPQPPIKGAYTSSLPAGRGGTQGAGQSVVSPILRLRHPQAQFRTQAHSYGRMARAKRGRPGHPLAQGLLWPSLVFVDRTSYAGVARLGPGLPTDRGRARAGEGQPWRAATMAGCGGGNPGNSKGNARAALVGATPLAGATPARARALPASGAHMAQEALLSNKTTLHREGRRSLASARGGRGRRREGAQFLSRRREEVWNPDRASWRGQCHPGGVNPGGTLPRATLTRWQPWATLVGTRPGGGNPGRGRTGQPGVAIETIKSTGRLNLKIE